MEQEKLLEDLGESYGYLKAYVEKRIELARLEALEKYAMGLSFAVTLILLVTIGGFVLGLLTLAFGFYLGRQLGSYSEAFLILAGLYTFIGLVILAFRKPLIQNPLLSNAIRSLDE